MESKIREDGYNGYIYMGGRDFLHLSCKGIGLYIKQDPKLFRLSKIDHAVGISGGGSKS